MRHVRRQTTGPSLLAFRQSTRTRGDAADPWSVVRRLDAHVEEVALERVP
jgi:hypothetical protein